MIVVCSTCQARFKVADEKIGPRGAKVRCSKCQTVFVVHKELGVMSAEPPAAPDSAVSPSPARPGFDLDLEGAPGAGVRPNGFAADPFGRAAQPPAPVPDPFAAAAPPEAQPQFDGADPFQAAPPAPPSAAADPFAAHDALTAASSAGFGATDPFVARVEPTGPGIPTSAMTDLSDLLGSSGAPPATEPPPVPPAPTPPPEPSGILETGFDFDPSAGAELGLEIAASPAAAPPPSAAPLPSDDLALDERTPAPVPAAPMPGFGDFAGADPFADQEAAPGPVPGFEEGGEFDAFSAPPEPRPAQPAQARVDAPPHAEAPPPVVGAQPATVETTDEVMARSGVHRRSRIRAITINAVSLVALLAVALGILALWRGVRPGSPGFLRPKEVLGAGGTEAAFATSQVRSGVYERLDASPLLFVSGVVASRASAPVAGLRVRVEVVRHGAVLARGEARAGAVPTPEDLHGTRDAAGLASAMERTAARAPGIVRPGEAVPFLVAIADYPADVAGAGIVLSVEPADAPPPAPAAPPAAPAPSAAPEGPKTP